MSDQVDVAARVEEELRWQTFLWAFHGELAAAFNKRCFGTIAGWASGVGSREATIDSLRVELKQLADEVLETRDVEFVRRLAAATGVAAAISCVLADELSGDERAVVALTAEEFDLVLKDDDLWVVPATASDDERMVFRAMVQHRLRQVAAALEANPVGDLIWCTAVSSALATT